MRFLLYVSRVLHSACYALYTVNFVNFSSLCFSSPIVATVTSLIDIPQHLWYRTMILHHPTIHTKPCSSYSGRSSSPTLPVLPGASNNATFPVYRRRHALCTVTLWFSVEDAFAVNFSSRKYSLSLSLFPFCLETNSPNFVHCSCSS